MSHVDRRALTILLAIASLAGPIQASAAGPAKAGTPAKPAQVAPLSAAKGPGEIRVRIFGYAPKVVAANLACMFQLYRNRSPVFQNWVQFGGISPNHGRGRGAGGEFPFVDGEWLYIQDLEPGVYDLHLTRIPSNPGFRPVHISGVVVEAGQVVELEEVHLQQGETVVQIGAQAVLPDPAVNVVDRFNALNDSVKAQLVAMQARLDAAEKANADLRKQLEAMPKTP